LASILALYLLEGARAVGELHSLQEYCHYGPREEATVELLPENIAQFFPPERDPFFPGGNVRDWWKGCLLGRPSSYLPIGHPRILDLWPFS
jgi:hypothetical protein